MYFSEGDTCEKKLVREYVLRQEHTDPTVGRLKRLGRLGRSREQICSVCSAALEAFGATQTLLDPIQHAKSKGGWLSAI